MPRRDRRLAQKVREKLIPALDAGAMQDITAEWLGITPEELAAELSFPRSPLRKAVAEAETALEIRLVSLVVAGAESDWKAAAWWLERRYPERWGKPEAGERRGGTEPAAVTPQAPASVAGGTPDPDDPLAGLRLIRDDTAKGHSHR